MLNRLLSAKKQRPAQQEESLDDRMRIFEDEIIKRIKVIQSFVKGLDGKVKRLRANRDSSQRKSRHGESMNESNVLPERLLSHDENG